MLAIRTQVGLSDSAFGTPDRKYSAYAFVDGGTFSGRGETATEAMKHLQSELEMELNEQVILLITQGEI